jgi:hypothetical protein
MSILWEDVYNTLCAESERTGLPECYKDDLHKHDAHRLQQNGFQEFMWVLRTHGTHMWTLEELRQNSSLMHPGVVSDIGGNVRWYHYKDGILAPVSLDDVQRIVSDYRREKESAEPSRMRGLSSWDWSIW